jgi:predicted nucleic acid-binding protein
LLIDTNTLLRTLQVRHPQYETVARALEALTARGREIHIVPQNLVELWVVATRPVPQNGLGLATTEAAAEVMRLKSMFPLLPDLPAIYPV